MKRGSVFFPALLLAAGLAGCGTSTGENLEQGMQLIEMLDYEGALQCFEAAAVNQENLQLVYRGQGLAYMGLTDYENAVDCLERALSLSGAWPDALDYDINYYLATAYYKAGQPEQAIAVYQAITDLKPGEKEAWYLKGTVELEQGKKEQAAADFDRAVAIAKDDYDLRIDIFCSCSRCGYDEMGAAYLEDVLENQTDKLSDYNMGRIYYYLEDYEQARLSLEKAKESGSADAYRLLGQTYEQLGDYNYAASIYSSYLETRQADAGIYNQLGLCKLRAGDYESALAAFQAGIEIEGNAALQSLKYNEIVAYESLGEFDQATALMEQYLTTYPDDEAARREYVFLQTR